MPRKYDDKYKLKLIEKTLQQPNRSIESIAIEAGIGKSTLGKWVHRYKTENKVQCVKKHSTLPGRLTALAACESLDDLAINAYCREHGIYRQQLEQWKDALMNDTKKSKKAPKNSELKQLREQNKLLQRELRRKEKALAEATAILVMKKKAELIWGTVDEDD